MTEAVVDSGRAVLAEYADLERRLADPEVFTDQALVRTLNKRYAALVWIRPWLSVTGTRWTRWTPPSNFSSAHGASPGCGVPFALTERRASL